jgi:hypothetical protein
MQNGPKIAPVVLALRVGHVFNMASEVAVRELSQA